MSAITHESTNMPPSDGADLTLQAAIRIGQTLCKTAFWDESGQQCNWMGRAVTGTMPSSMITSSAALGGDLYGGSPGVALFLTELCAHAPEPELKRTAGGAIRRSIQYLRHAPAHNSPLSFFSGHLGLAHTIARFMDLNLATDLEDDFSRLLEQVSAAAGNSQLFDVISGSAGAIPVLLLLARRPGLDGLRDLASTCGEELCRTAQRTGESCCWDSAQVSGPGFNFPPLTGLSHGASGIALALLELYAETGEAEFLQTARGAFMYEDSLFSQEQGNWLDVREPFSNQGGTLTGIFASLWCHGAPGIALARLRAMHLDPERTEQHEAMARTALATTLSALEHNLAAPGLDTTLCHGICGLSEIVLICGEALDDDTLRATAAHTARELIRRYDTAGDWPTGLLGGGPNPSLMTGVAGVGHHFLRLHARREVPPVLFPVCAGW